MYNRGQLMRDRIIIRLAAAVLALAAAIAVPGMAWALGLGEIQTDTRIGQPFTAKIPIVGASADTLQGLKVGLASNEDYKNAGLDEPDYLFSLKFSIEQGPQGPYVRVTSTKPVRLPFLHLLLHADWASGEITRQYTVLLNPPTFVAGTEGGQSVSTPAAPAQSVPAQAPARQAPAQTVAQQPAPRPAQTAARAAPTPVSPPQSQPSHPARPARTLPETYAVHHGDTLWGLAQQLRTGSGITTNQMMIALYRANPHAFRGNINRLKAGYVLRVPTRDEITRIASGEATRIVARQNRDWQSTRVAAGGGAAAQSPQQQVAANAGTPAGGEAQQATAAATGGRVVLTTPEVTTATGNAAVPGSSVAGQASGAAVAASTAMNAAASNAATSSAMAGTGASAGGPVKVHSSAMAGLASAAKSQATAAVAAAKAKPTGASRKPAAKQPGSKPANSANSVNTGEGAQSGLMYWLQRPSGWIVIGAVVLLLATLLLWLVKRRHGSSPRGGKAAAAEAARDEQEAAATAEAGAGGEAGTAEAPVIEAESTQSAPGATAAEGVSEGAGELGIATYIGGPSLDVNKVDAMDEAELHIGFGDYGKAAQILRDGIAKEPERHELHRKLLDVLFAAGDGEGFAEEAATYRKETGGAADWDEIARMGRQLRPHDDQFAEDAAPGGTAASGGGAASAGEDDLVDLDLDRLSTGTEKEADQSEFERTMDELSTFIETYVPAAEDTPLPLQLPPEEAGKAADKQEEAAAGEDREVPSAPAFGEDGALDFHLDEEDLPPARPETPKSEAPAASDMEGLDLDLDEGGVPEGGMVDTKLDLARAYIDMGDPDSARGVLEEVIDEGSDEQSGEARRLLESLD